MEQMHRICKQNKKGTVSLIFAIHFTIDYFHIFSLKLQFQLKIKYHKLQEIIRIIY